MRAFVFAKKKQIVISYAEKCNPSKKRTAGRQHIVVHMNTHVYYHSFRVHSTIYISVITPKCTQTQQKPTKNEIARAKEKTKKSK